MCAPFETLWGSIWRFCLPALLVISSFLSNGHSSSAWAHTLSYSNCNNPDLLKSQILLCFETGTQWLVSLFFLSLTKLNSTAVIWSANTLLALHKNRWILFLSLGHIVISAERRACFQNTGSCLSWGRVVAMVISQSLERMRSWP